jgi:hypothetical protein
VGQIVRPGGPLADDDEDDLLDRLCAMAVVIARARSALVIVPDGRHAQVPGLAGIDGRHRGALPQAATQLPATEGIGLFKNLACEPWYRSQPLARLAPLARTAIVMDLTDRDHAVVGRLIVFDPDLRWAGLSHAVTMLEHTGVAVGLHLALRYRLFHAELSRQGFAEDAGDRQSLDAVSAFLFETLSKQQHWRKVGTVSYFAARCWKHAIKEHQMSALKALKRHMPQTFVETVATELADVARGIVSLASINHVVPMPCGHSGRPDCLSVRLAQSVADATGIPFMNAFEPAYREGSSHPRQSATLGLLRLRERPVESVLLVDDVASTGTHIERAVTALRQSAKHVVALVWIGNR